MSASDTNTQTHTQTQTHTHTHYIYADTPAKREAVKDYVTGRSSGYDVYLSIPEGTVLPELPEFPDGLDIKPFVKNSCFKAFVRGPVGKLDAIITKLDELGITATVTQDTLRDNIYHLKFDQGGIGASALGTEIPFDETNTGVIKRWLRKGKYDDVKVQEYIKYLLVDNFQNDSHLQELSVTHRGWIPLKTRSNTPKGLLTFKGARKMRLSADVVQAVVAGLEGGKISDNGDFVTCRCIEEWLAANNALD